MLPLFVQRFILNLVDVRWQQIKQQATDNEDSQGDVVPPQSVSAPTAFSRNLRSVTRSRSRSRSGSRSSLSSSSSAVAEAEADDMEGFDFEESINSKRRELLADAESLAENAKTLAATAAEASVSKSENTDGENSGAGKKPFINGIDMFAEELHIEAESYNVSASLSFGNIVESLWINVSKNEILPGLHRAKPAL